VSRRSLQRATRSRTRIGLAFLLPILAIAVPINVALFAGEAALSGPAAAQGSRDTTYSAGTPTVSTITNGTSAAPWNESQGDPDFSSYSTQPPGTLLPTYTPGGATENTGGVTEPNLAVYPASDSGTDGNFPYPSGTVGTPGPLTGYCGTGNNANASLGSPARQPAETTLPFAPAYFPHIVRNTDGSLTGYFDYRPKDADEALVAATSKDNGQDWTYDGEALEENPGYCPSADINDDGEGHSNVITVAGQTYLYTLPRAAGDMQGVGMIVHQFGPTESNPLEGLPAVEKIGIDPDAFVPTGTSALDVTSGPAVTIPLTSLGTAGSPEQLVVGSFVDLTQTPGVPTVITCTGLGASSLTGCTTASGSSVVVQAGDLIEQVLGFTTPSSDVGLVIPAGPNKTTGDGGLSSFTIDATSGNPGFADPLTGTTFNNNAPNRLYLKGTAIYCSQANANPTSHIEDCTTGPGNSSDTITSALEPITGDPIIPATAYDPAAGDGMTSGLVAPDGIVGTLPSFPNNGTPGSGVTYVMYTEKELNYYIAAETTGSGTFSSTTGGTIASTPGDYISQDLPSTGPWTVQIGATQPSAQGGATAIIPVTCTGLNETTGAFSGCTVPTADNAWTWASNSYIAAPGAANVPYSTLELTGEGKAANVAKLSGNNEDLTILRVAYTTNGTTFSDAGLANNGIISGENDCATGDPVCTSTSSYDDISNPSTTISPSNLNTYANNDAANGSGPVTGGTDTGGTPDTDEMRWVGSAGSIIVNPDGSYGLFLSGAWAADGDSDAFNQIFYATSTNGEYWSVPTPVVSTDYSFAASATQDGELSGDQDDPLGISAYYSGRAYGPSVVQNPNGTLTMVFAGYRLPKPITNAGTVLGTNSSDQYTIGSSDPALYRNIIVLTLQSSTSPGVSTTTSLATSDSRPVVGEQVTYTATVAPISPGTGTPTGTVSFKGDAGTLCTTSLDEDASDQATCSTTYEAAGSDSVTATYNSDSNYATSTSNTVPETISLASSTTTSAPGSASVVLGQENTDTATVTGSGSADPTGTVTFYECGPTVSADPCTTGTEFDTEMLSGTSEPSQVTSASFTPTSGGYWCFAAVYSGDPNYASSNDESVDECFDVTQASSSVSSTPGISSITLGETNDDSASVTGSVGSVDPTGSVSFYECAPGTSPCNDSSGTLINTVGLSGTSNPDTVTSADITPDSTGDWCFAAVYSGDSNYIGSSDATSDECFAVNRGSSTTTSEPVSSNVVLGGSDSDNATVTGSDPDIDPSGTVTFYYCGPDLTETGCTPSSGTEFDSESLSGGTNPDTVTSASFTPQTAGYWCFAAVYSGDTNYTSSSDTTTEECFDVGVTGSTTSSTPESGTIALGGSDSDQAKVTGSVSGIDPSGKVDFYYCGPDASATPCSSGTQTLFDTVKLSGSSNPETADSTSFTPTGAGYWCFEAVYSGDTNYSGSSDDSTAECFDVSQGTTSTVSSPSGSTVVLGNTETDSASVTGSDASIDPTGTVTFYECGPSSTSCNSTTGTEFDTESVSIGNPAAASSAGLLPTSVGSWCFAAVYSGDSNYSGSSDTTSDECFNVTQATSSTTSVPKSGSITLGQTIDDTATVTGAATIAPTGTVTFYECGPLTSVETCSAGDKTPILLGGGNSAVPLGNPSGDTSSATSVFFTPNAVGTWCFESYYSGSSNFASSSDTSTDECFSVTAATATLTTSPSEPSSTYPATETDSATLVGNTAGGAPTGTVTFYVCAPTTSPTACTSETDQVGSPVNLKAVSGTDASVATSASFKPAGGPGYYCFGAVYSGSTNYLGATDTSDTTECFFSEASPSITSFSPASGKVGSSVSIKGTNLQYVTSVTVDGKSATITSKTATKIVFKVPTKAKTGYIVVSGEYGSATSKTKYKVT
jgi:Bacterial Ig-like domain (group 3)